MAQVAQLICLEQQHVVEVVDAKVDVTSKGSGRSRYAPALAMSARPPMACMAATAASVKARSPALLTMAFQPACITAVMYQGTRED